MSDIPFSQIGIPTRHNIVTVCDHASNFVPEGIELGVSRQIMQKHIAWDIGAAGVVGRLARRHAFPAHLGEISRLVIDLHREEEARELIPQTSDGILIPGNIGADRDARLRDYYRPYHAALTKWLAACAPKLILSIHSFTPKLESTGEERPWEIGLLYNKDNRAAKHAIRMFSEMGVKVGDNEPYSGRQLNATMNTHAEDMGRPYCAIEIRNDLIMNESGQARYAAMIADVAGRTMHALDLA